MNEKHENHGKLLKIEQVAEMFAIQPKTVMSWTKKGLLPAIKVGRTTRYRPEDVQHLIDRHRTKVQEDTNDLG
jgi:excisionase family DNA binding protein